MLILSFNFLCFLIVLTAISLLIHLPDYWAGHDRDLPPLSAAPAVQGLRSPVRLPCTSCWAGSPALQTVAAHYSYPWQQ